MSRSSDEMTFENILIKDNTIYPLFSRAYIAFNQSVTEDIIMVAYLAEIPKDADYKIGDILFRYK